MVLVSGLSRHGTKISASQPPPREPNRLVRFGCLNLSIMRLYPFNSLFKAKPCVSTEARLYVAIADENLCKSHPDDELTPVKPVIFSGADRTTLHL